MQDEEEGGDGDERDTEEGPGFFAGAHGTGQVFGRGIIGCGRGVRNGIERGGSGSWFGVLVREPGADGGGMVRGVNFALVINRHESHQFPCKFVRKAKVPPAHAPGTSGGGHDKPPGISVREVVWFADGKGPGLSRFQEALAKEGRKL